MEFFMKAFVIVFLAGISTFAAYDGFICREDHRHEGGSLTELVLISGNDGYRLESQFIESYGATKIDVKNLAERLTCNFDKEAILAFCESPSGLKVLIGESRETFLDSLGDDKKKSLRFTDISIYGNNAEESLRFPASNCQSFGG